MTRRKAAPHAYIKAKKTRAERIPEIIEFMHSYFEQFGRVPKASEIVANTPALQMSEITPIRTKLIAWGELIIEGRNQTMKRKPRLCAFCRNFNGEDICANNMEYTTAFDTCAVFSRLMIMEKI